MSSIYDWSTTAASNGNSDASINLAEGMPPSAMNDSARQMMGREAEILKDLGGGIAAGGTANALTLTAASAFTTLADGRIVAFRAIADNAAGAVTINVNAISAKSIRKMVGSGETDLAAGDIKNGGIFVLRYGTAFNGGAGAWMLQNPVIDTPNIVTLTGTQTLTNKTLTSPAINGGTHSGAAFNGTLGATTPSTVAATTGAFSAQLTAKTGTNPDSTGQPSGTWASIIYNATNTISYNGLLVKNNWGSSTATIFEVGNDFVGGAYSSKFKIDGAGNITASGSTHSFTGNTTVTGTLNATTLQQGGSALPFTKSFESSQQTISSNGSFVVAHGLGTTPKLYRGYIQCVGAENGYSIGDELPMDSASTDATAGQTGVAIVPDATNITVRYSANMFVMPNKTSGGMPRGTYANWKYIVRAWA